MALVVGFPSCRTGQLVSAVASQRRFITCLGVHRCMAVFAWAPGRDPRGFAAHLTAGAVRFSLEQRGQFLPEVVRAMSRSFAGTPRADVCVHFVGDLYGEPLQRYFPESPAAQCCSLHLEVALRDAGFTRIDKALTTLFQEPAAEPRLRSAGAGDGRRFSFAALDVESGGVLAQAAGTVAETRVAAGASWPQLEAEYEQDKLLGRQRGSLSPITQASGAHVDIWTAYYELAAHPLPVVLVLAALLLLLLRTAPRLVLGGDGPEEQAAWWRL